MPSSLSERIVVPGVAPRGRVEAGRRLVEEDQLRVADEREREVEPAQLTARERACHRVLLALQPAERDHLVDVARVRVHRAKCATASRTLMWRYRPVALEDDPDPRAQRARALAGIEAEHADLAGGALAVALEDLDGGRLAGAVRPEQTEHLAAADLEVDSANGLELGVGLAQSAGPAIAASDTVADDGSAGAHGNHRRTLGAS